VLPKSTIYRKERFMLQNEETYVPGHVPPTERKLKPSEALRIGISKRPPVKDRYEYFKDGGSCAMAAMYEAITGNTLSGSREDQSNIINYTLRKHYPGLDLADIGFRFVGHVIFQPSSREEIADWLERQGL
jgi:hypothetical protein